MSLKIVVRFLQYLSILLVLRPYKIKFIYSLFEQGQPDSVELIYIKECQEFTCWKLYFTRKNLCVCGSLIGNECLKDHIF